MKEDFLHHIWKFKKISPISLQTTTGENLEILHFGTYTQQQGPDFFNAQIILNQQKWAGNIEIHLKSSDWFLHQHEKDSNYDNVILHVVWEHDTPIFHQNNQEIPVLELKNYVSQEEVSKYENLMKPKNWMYCENQVQQVDNFVLENWKERLFIERLEQKERTIAEVLKETENDWEQVLFILLAKNFGLNTNGETFFKMAKKIPFAVIRKELFDLSNLEALFFGQLNMLPSEPEDFYTKDLVFRYHYLVYKYQLQSSNFESVTFFKHRPDNFPSIRLAQFALLLHQHINLFSTIITSFNLTELYQIFDNSTSEYWVSHYSFDKNSVSKTKKTSKSFIDLLIINTIIPFQFAYAKSQGKDISEKLFQLVKEILPEKNTITDKFYDLGLKSSNAFDSQSFIQLKKEYCDQKKCLQCGIGLYLLKN